jgi:glutamate---methylamine ligase
MINLEETSMSEPFKSVVAIKPSVKHFMFCFVDLYGYSRAKLVPRAYFESVANDHGIQFGGFASCLGLPQDSESITGQPDLSSLIHLPWNEEVAWIPVDVYHRGELLNLAPRNCLKRMINLGREKSWEINVGIESEFFLLNLTGDAIADNLDNKIENSYDQDALMRQYAFLSEITGYMQELGWEPYQIDHEDGTGQFELNWKYTGALCAADRHSFFKFMARSVAEKHRLRITFMPKPFDDHVGSGCHLHLSVWQGQKNLFLGEESGDGLSPLGLNFMAGLMRHTPELCAVTNPIVNSYRRTLPPLSLGTKQWGRNTVSYSNDNRTHMFRIPARGRFEFRLPDGAANSYLMLAAIIAAGLEGIRLALDPGPPSKINMSAITEDKKNLVSQIPEDLHQALKLFKNSSLIRSNFGDDLVDKYFDIHDHIWDVYVRKVTTWERSMALDC